MLIPPDALNPETLRALCEEFVSRDGTQTGDLQEAAQKIVRLLHEGKAVISFEESDEEGVSCQILLREEFDKRQRSKPTA